MIVKPKLMQFLPNMVVYFVFRHFLSEFLWTNVMLVSLLMCKDILFRTAAVWVWEHSPCKSCIGWAKMHKNSCH